MQSDLKLETDFKSVEYEVFDPRGSCQMDVLARPLGSLLAGIKFKEDDHNDN